MKHILTSILLFLYSSILFAQESPRPTAEEAETTDLFLTYWPVVLLPIFMIVIWGAYRRRKRKEKQVN